MRSFFEMCIRDSSNTEHLNSVLAKLRKVRDVIQVIRI